MIFLMSMDPVKTIFNYPPAIVERCKALGLLTWLGYSMCIAAATLQLLADSQSHRFRDAPITSNVPAYSSKYQIL